jgi:cytochrome c oxidase cbb3-type subunit III
MAKNEMPPRKDSFEAPNKLNNGVQTTGHEWDGIQEYNNPLPRWWVWVFLATIVFAIGYVAYYPAFPLVHETVSGWSSRGQLATSLQQAQTDKQAFEDKISAMDVQAIADDAEVRTYATAAGRMLFSVNCSQCHGSGAAGAKGYPNLLDDEWIHGGTLADIAYTITHGIRNGTDPEARNPGPMAAFGKDELLTKEQIDDVVNYLSVLSHGFKGNESTERGKAVFAENCALCHGDQGQGNRELGAPPLNNAIWLYGGSNKDRFETLWSGRAGVMPAWGPKLSESDIKKLAVYVHGLGGGEAVATSPAVSATEVAPAAAAATRE